MDNFDGGLDEIQDVAKPCWIILYRYDSPASVILGFKPISK